MAAGGCCWLEAGREGEGELKVMLDAQTEGLLIKPWSGVRLACRCKMSGGDDDRGTRLLQELPQGARGGGPCMQRKDEM